jgi:hypothetical protein
MSGVAENLGKLIESLAEVNPLLLLALFSLGFLLFGFVKAQWLSLLLAAWSGVCLAFLLSPGGRQISEDTARMPEALPRAQCVYGAVRAGALWDEGAVTRSGKCVYGGVGFTGSTNPSAAEKKLAATQRAISAAYLR